MVIRYTKADGTCVIDIFHKDGVVVDTATYQMISRAAEKLYGTCVAIGDQRTQGGYIRDLGEHHNNSLVVCWIISSHNSSRRPTIHIRKGSPDHFLYSTTPISETNSLTMYIKRP